MEGEWPGVMLGGAMDCCCWAAFAFLSISSYPSSALYPLNPRSPRSMVAGGAGGGGAGEDIVAGEKEGEGPEEVGERERFWRITL